MVVFVDVDDTLVRALHAEGHELYLWSTGGADYARESAVELGIEGLFRGFMPKPEIYIDDQEFGEWRGLVYERP